MGEGGAELGSEGVDSNVTLKSRQLWGRKRVAALKGQRHSRIW